MADDVTLSAGTADGAVIATDETSGGERQYQIVKLADGTADGETRIASGNGTSTNALRVTVSSDSTGVVSVDDNGNALTVDNDGTFAVQISDTSFAVADGNALGEGVLVQGDDGTDRKNIHVDATTGDVQVDVTNTVTVDGSGVTQPVSGTVTANPASGTIDTVTTVGTITNPVTVDLTTNNDIQGATAEGVAVSGNPFLIAGDDGTNVKHVAVDTDGHVQVDVLSGGGSGTEYTEDAAAAADPVGLAQILVRQDTPAGLTTTNGDNVARRGTDFGAAFTQILDSSGNFIDSFGGSGGTSSADDADFVAGTTLGTIAQAVYESSPTSVTDGDVGAVGMSADRRLHVDAQIVGTDAALDVSAATIDSTISGAALTALQLIDDAVYADDADWTDGSSKHVLTGGLYQSAPQSITDGDVGPIQVTANGYQIVSVNGSVTVDATSSGDVPITLGGEAVVLGAGTAEIGKLAAGTASIGTLGANSGVDIGDVDVLSLPASTNTLEVVGDVAHGLAAAGNPILAGAQATNNVEGLTQVDDGDAVNVQADLNGVLVTRPHTTLEEILTERVTNTNGTSTDMTGAFAAGGSGIHNYVTTISVYNSSATDGYIDLRDGAAGSVVFTVPAPQTGGSVINLPVPLKFADNAAVAYHVSGALSTVYISLVGFQAKG